MAVPEPPLPSMDRTYNIIVTGVGGTGVVTVGAILGMSAHLEGKGCGMIDMAGLAQKGGAVFSHVRIAPTPADISAIRVSAGKADMVLNEFRQQMRADLRTQAYRSTMPDGTVPELRRQLDAVRASIRDSLTR